MSWSAILETPITNKNKRIVVCSNCGLLYDLHYIDNVEIEKGKVVKFYCGYCGMVDVVYKNLNDFK